MHFRHAFELMPSSFGRVESHCFGCESVFRDPDAQGIAETVFEQAIEKDPMKPQSSYLLGYLREEQGRYPEALQMFRNAVALDGEYLNAWKHLNDLGDRTYVDSDERDIARLKLLRLDPAQRHVHYDLQMMRDLNGLWKEIESIGQREVPHPSEVTYRLAASADKYDAALEKLPPEIRAQMAQYSALVELSRDEKHVLDPAVVVLNHAIVQRAAALMGIASDQY